MAFNFNKDLYMIEVVVADETGDFIETQLIFSYPERNFVISARHGGVEDARTFKSLYRLHDAATGFKIFKSDLGMFSLAESNSEWRQFFGRRYFADEGYGFAIDRTRTDFETQARKRIQEALPAQKRHLLPFEDRMGSSLLHNFAHADARDSHIKRITAFLDKQQAA